MSVLLHGKYDEVFKFHSSGMAELIHETSDYLKEVEGREGKIEKIEFTNDEEKQTYSFLIHYPPGYDRYGYIDFGVL